MCVMVGVNVTVGVCVIVPVDVTVEVVVSVLVVVRVMVGNAVIVTVTVTVEVPVTVGVRLTVGLNVMVGVTVAVTGIETSVRLKVRTRNTAAWARLTGCTGQYRLVPQPLVMLCAASCSIQAAAQYVLATSLKTPVAAGGA